MSVMYLDGSAESSIALASYAVAIHDGDDTSAIGAELFNHMQECIAYNKTADVTVVEYLNILLPAFHSLMQRCVSDEEYLLVKARCLTEYSKLEALFVPSDVIGVFLDYIWIVSIGNKIVPQAFSNMFNSTLETDAFPSVSRYVLLTILNALMGVNGYADPTLKPILTKILASLKAMNDNGILVGEKLPHFLN